jgi:mannose-1-phosphate guanylyltransferase
MLHAVIMAGGAGTRFWPASRTTTPKQLLELFEDRTMIRATVDRLEGLIPADRLLVITNEQLVEPISRQLPDIPLGSILGEPCKRDTAPCIGLAAEVLLSFDPEATMLVMPADHIIRPHGLFQQVVRQAVDLVEQRPQRLVTFGIRPTYPADTFGYIERGTPLPSSHSAAPVYSVKMFREKPSVEVAEQYLAAGGYYWNAGIFVWKARTIRDALKRFEPKMSAHLAEIARQLGTDEFPRTLAREFAAIRGTSIDYAVMERYDDVVVIEAPFDWDDVGNWRSLVRLRGTDEFGNTVVGKHLGLDSHDCIIRTTDDHLVVTLGMEDCIIVHTPDATLVARKQDEEAIRKVVEQIKARGWGEYL